MALITHTSFIDAISRMHQLHGGSGQNAPATAVSFCPSFK